MSVREENVDRNCYGRTPSPSRNVQPVPRLFVGYQRVSVPRRRMHGSLFSDRIMKATGRRNLRSDGENTILRIPASRTVFMRALCVLSVVLVCVMGTVQALHAHPENSTTSHHACSICMTAHAGMSVESGTIAPVMVAAVLAAVVPECSGIFRPATAHFIRPPPAF